MTTIPAGQVHEHEQRAALAALTYAADFPDRRLIGLLTTLSPANVVAVIKTGGLHDGAEMPEIAAGYLSAAAGTLARWRRRLQDAPADGGLGAAARHGFRLVCPGEPGWPISLYDLGPDRPCALWAKGADLPQPDTAVAVTGSRAATAYGMRIAAQIAADLAECDTPVVSGGAPGIDLAAHRAALACGGTTVAVVPSGPGAACGGTHAGLLEAIASSGGTVVTEQPPGQPATRLRYVRRGRLITALSSGVVLVEASPHGTAIRIARDAASLGKPLMAVPGRVASVQSAGCHRLIRAGAALVTSAEEVRSTITACQQRRLGTPVFSRFSGPG